MGSEVFLCERSQPCGVQFSRPREILFSQDPLDPNVDWERAQPLVGEEHHTISNLCAHARQLTQAHVKIGIRQHRHLLKVNFAGRGLSGRHQQVFRAITKCTFA
jgi:hypothetical protein